MRNFRPSLVAGAIALALCTGTASAQFSGTYAFGDSLYDAGQYGSRFTTNPGLVVPMYVGQNWGLPVTPSFTGGNDYAQGGALMNSPQPPGDVPPGLPNLSVTAQVNQFLAKGPLDRNALYQLEGGGNDIVNQFTLYATGQISSTQAQAAVAQAAIDLATQAVKLQAAGAQYIIVQTAPDAGKSPYAAPFGPAAQKGLTDLSGLFNTTLNAAIGQSRLQVIQFNLFKLMNEVIATPAAYGFVNTTGVACTVGADQCTSSTLVAPNANLNYVFADGKHGTTGFYQLQAQAVESMIEGPLQMAALGDAPMGVERASWRAVDGRMMAGIDRAGPARKFQAWASYDYAGEDITGTGLSTSGNINTVAVGGDVRLSDRLLAGVAFTYSEYKGDFSDSGGSFKLKEPTMTVYVGYGDGPWYVGGTLGAGNLDYSSVQRNIALGAATRTENGTTNGYQTVARVLGGYWFRQGDWEHGPFAQADLGQGRSCANSANRDPTARRSPTASRRTRRSSPASAGRSPATSSGWRPFARATWEYDFKNDERQVSATPVGLNGTYYVPVSKPDENYALFDLGVSKDFGGVTGYIAGNASAGKSNGDFWAVTVGFRMPI